MTKYIDMNLEQLTKEERENRCLGIVSLIGFGITVLVGIGLAMFTEQSINVYIVAFFIALFLGECELFAQKELRFVQLLKYLKNSKGDWK